MCDSLRAIPLIVALFVCGCNGLSQPNSRVLKTADGIELVGRLQGHGEPSQIFYITAGGTRDLLNQNWKLKVADEVYELNALTPDILKNATAKLVNPSYTSAVDDLHAYFGWGDQNRDGAIEIHFAGSKISKLLMRWHLEKPSPFKFAVNGSEFFSLPLSEDTIKPNLRTPLTTNDLVMK